VDFRRDENVWDLVFLLIGLWDIIIHGIVRRKTWLTISEIY
jgi:hypothetical protein